MSVCVCCLSSSLLWKSHPRDMQEMLVFSISEQSYYSTKPRKLFVVLFFSDGNGEKAGGRGQRQSNEGIALYAAEATGLYSTRLLVYSVVSCSAQSQVIANYLQYLGLILGETHQLSLP